MSDEEKSVKLILMYIAHLGRFCFKLKGKKATLVTDPYERNDGQLMTKTKADIVTLSGQEKPSLNRLVGKPFVIQGPGEYEIRGVSIFGLPFGETTAYLYRWDELKIAYLASLNGKLTEKQIEELGEIDIFLVPGLKKALTMIEQLEPKILIPINSSPEFLVEIGEKGLKPQKNLNVVKSTLPEEREVIWLKK